MKNRVMWAFVYIINVWFLGNAESNSDDCQCEIDFKIVARRTTFPILMDVVTRTVLYPEVGTTILYIPAESYIELYCTSGGLFLYNKTTEVHSSFEAVLLLQCVHGTVFESRFEELDITKIDCMEELKTTLRISKAWYMMTNKHLQLGAGLVDGTYLTVFNIYFQYKQQITKFVQHVVSGHYISENGKYTNKFKDCDQIITRYPRNHLFTIAKPVDRFYLMENLKIRYNTVLGFEPQYADGLWFTKGFFVPEEDFFYGHEREATHYYLNAFPMWVHLPTDALGWVENFVRKYSYHKKVRLIVFSGYHGVLMERHITSKEYVPIYLTDERQIPIPNWVWKVVYDPINKAGLAFVLSNGINKGFICPDLSGNFSWVDILPEQNKSGLHICSIDNFQAKLAELPNLEVIQFLEL